MHLYMHLYINWYIFIYIYENRTGKQGKSGNAFSLKSLQYL